MAATPRNRPPATTHLNRPTEFEASVLYNMVTLISHQNHLNSEDHPFKFDLSDPHSHIGRIFE